MSFLRKRKKRKRLAPEAEATAPVKHPKKRKVTPVEVKLLAIDALKAGITSSEVCELIGLCCPSHAPESKRTTIDEGQSSWYYCGKC